MNLRFLRQLSTLQLALLASVLVPNLRGAERALVAVSALALHGAPQRLVDPLPDTAPVRRLVDAYLEHWPEVTSRDRPGLLRAADRLGALHRAASWQRLLAPVEPTKVLAYGRNYAEHAAEFAAAHQVGDLPGGLRDVVDRGGDVRRGALVSEQELTQ